MEPFQIHIKIHSQFSWPFTNIAGVAASGRMFAEVHVKDQKKQNKKPKTTMQGNPRLGWEEVRRNDWLDRCYFKTRSKYICRRNKSHFNKHDCPLRGESSGTAKFNHKGLGRWIYTAHQAHYYCKLIPLDFKLTLWCPPYGGGCLSL